MTNTFDEIANRFSSPDPEWNVKLGSKDLKGNIDYFETEFAINQPSKVNVKLSGVQRFNTDLVQGKELVLEKEGFEMFRGVVQQAENKTGGKSFLQVAGYSKELQGKNDKVFKPADSATATEIINFLVDGYTVQSTGKTFSTSFDLPTTINVEEFRVKETAIKDLNRLASEYGLEWYVTFDGSNNPVLNVDTTLTNTASDGTPVGKFTTEGPEPNAREIKQNTNKDKGDFKAAVVRGAGDGDDQITASAERAEIISSDKTDDTFTVKEDKTAVINSGDTIKIRKKSSILGGGRSEQDEFTVSSTSFDSTNNETTVSVNENVEQDTGGEFSVGGSSGTMVYTVNAVGDEKTKIFTDKTIVSQEEAEKTVLRLLSSRSTAYRDVEVTPSDSYKLYGLGSVFEVVDKDAKVNGVHRVVKTRLKIRFDQNEAESTVHLSNKPASFYDDFSNLSDTTKSQTDFGQGSKNVWGEKESSNATGSEPFKLDFEVPEDVIDISGRNRLDSIELNFASSSFQGSEAGDTTTVDNFDPSAKVVDTTVANQGIQIENKEITQHGHSVGSATTQGATGRDFLVSTGNAFSFSENVPSSGFTQIGSSLDALNPENDLEHEIILEISSLSNPSTANLHFAVLSGVPVANFEINPLDPVVGEPVQFEDTSSTPGLFGSRVYNWTFGDGSGDQIFGEPGDTSNTYSSAGTFTVTLELVDDTTGATLDTVSKDVEVRSSSQALTEIAEEKNKKSLSVDQVDDFSPTSLEEEETIGTQDSASIDVSITDNETQYIRNDQESNDFGFDAVIKDNDSNRCDSVIVKAFFLKDRDTNFFSLVKDLGTINICSLSVFTGLDVNMDEPIDEENPFRGPGRYTPQIITDEGGARNLGDDFTIASRVVESFSATDNPGTGDNPQTVEFEVDGYFGQGIQRLEFYIGDDDGTQLGSNVTREASVDLSDDTGFLETGTIELEPGEFTTFNSDETETGIEVVGTDDFDAFIRVNGTARNPSEDDDVPGVPFQNELTLRLRKSVSNFSVSGGGDYNGAVFETHAEGLTEQASQISTGDKIAHVRAIDANGNEIKNVSSSGVDFDTDSFTITVNQPPTSDFTFSPSNPDTFETVQFTDQATDPDGDSTIQKYEWDFGDGDTQVINSSNGDTTKSYSSAGTFTVSLTVTDDKGATDTQTKQITVGQTDVLDNTVSLTGVDNVGSPGTQIASGNGTTAVLSGVSEVGANTSPAQDNAKLVERFRIPYRAISSEYEVYVATQGSANPSITGELSLKQINHEHDIPRQSNVPTGGAEDERIKYQKATGDDGSILADFSTNDTEILLDTTENSLNVTITVANEDSNGNLSRQETIQANNGTALTSNSYQDDELFIRIDSATDGNGNFSTEEFSVTDLEGEDSISLAAITGDRFRSSSEAQETDNVLDETDSSTEVPLEVDTNLLSGSVADNYKIFLDTDPNNSGTNTLRKITGLLYPGQNTSQTDRDREKQLNQRFTIQSASPNQFKINGDKTPFIQSGDLLRVTGSNSNNKDFTVSSTSFDSGSNQTTISVNESVANDSTGELELRLIDETGFYQLQLEPDDPTFTKARVYLEHHKDADGNR